MILNSKKNLTGQHLRTAIRNIKAGIKTGALSYDTAKKMARPYISEMNRRGAIIAKEHGKRFIPFTFTKIMG